eukprot:CAMPEP_0117454980 /NCGR_PEP_ID=MMETSP0759-20121206/11105_1 /TAXON_ID=63605 /ORGANISM="Percolomonas cosmopolitus, Strain WS" /LENGTH=1897 /DNA_ID=CAMNT_0005248233 /DNA_START=981 /DNA_END=6675 /DNA_ORIENTATION=+
MKMLEYRNSLPKEYGYAHFDDVDANLVDEILQDMTGESVFNSDISSRLQTEEEGESASLQSSSSAQNPRQGLVRYRSFHLLTAMDVAEEETARVSSVNGMKRSESSMMISVKTDEESVDQQRQRESADFICKQFHSLNASIQRYTATSPEEDESLVALLLIHCLKRLLNQSQEQLSHKEFQKMWLNILKVQYLLSVICKLPYLMNIEREALRKAIQELQRKLWHRKQVIAIIYASEMNVLSNPFREKLTQTVLKESSTETLNELIQEKCENYAMKIQNAASDGNSWKTIYYCELLMDVLVDNQDVLERGPFTILQMLIPVLGTLVEKNEANYDVTRKVLRACFEVMYLCLIMQRTTGIALNQADRECLTKNLKEFEHKFVHPTFSEIYQAEFSDSLDIFDRTFDLQFYLNGIRQLMILLKDTRNVFNEFLDAFSLSQPLKFLKYLRDLKDQIPMLQTLRMLDLYSKYRVPKCNVKALLRENTFLWLSPLPTFLHLVLMADIASHGLDESDDEQDSDTLRRRLFSYTHYPKIVVYVETLIRLLSVGYCVGPAFRVRKKAIFLAVTLFPKESKMDRRIASITDHHIQDLLQSSLFPRIKYGHVDCLIQYALPAVKWLGITFFLNHTRQVYRFSTPESSSEKDMHWLYSNLQDTKKNILTVVKGESGTGKSCLLRHLASHLLEECSIYQSQCARNSQFPMDDADIDVETNCEILHKAVMLSLAQEISEIFPTQQQLALFKIQLLRLLKRQPFYLFIDGYDEVRQRDIAGFNAVLMHLFGSTTLSTTGLSVLKLIVTTRGDAINLLPSSLPHLTIQIKNFTKKTNEEFVKSVLKSMVPLPKNTKTIREKIKQTKGVLKNALLTTLLLKELTKRDSSIDDVLIPNNIFDLYERLMRSAVEEAKSKTTTVDGPNILLQSESDWILRALSVLAFIITRTGKNSTDHLVRMLKEERSFGLIDQQKWMETISVETIVHSLIGFSSITLHSPDYLQFAHRSIQEYFAARFITDPEVSTKKIREKCNSQQTLRFSLLELFSSHQKSLYTTNWRCVMKMIFARFSLDAANIVPDPLVHLYSLVKSRDVKMELRSSLHIFLFETIPQSTQQFPKSKQKQMMEHLSQSVFQACNSHGLNSHLILNKMALPSGVRPLFKEIPYSMEKPALENFKSLSLRCIDVSKDYNSFVVGTFRIVQTFDCNLGLSMLRYEHDSIISCIICTTRSTYLIGDVDGKIYRLPELGPGYSPAQSPSSSKDSALNHIATCLGTVIQIRNLGDHIVALTKSNDNVFHVQTIDTTRPTGQNSIIWTFQCSNKVHVLFAMSTTVFLLLETDSMGKHLVRLLHAGGENSIIQNDVHITSLCKLSASFYCVGFDDGHVEIFELGASEPYRIINCGKDYQSGEMRSPSSIQPIRKLIALSEREIAVCFVARVIFIRDWQLDEAKMMQYCWNKPKVKFIFRMNDDADQLLYVSEGKVRRIKIWFSSIDEERAKQYIENPLVVSPHPQLSSLERTTIGSLVHCVKFSSGRVLIKSKRGTVYPSKSCTPSLVLCKEKNDLIGIHEGEHNISLFMRSRCGDIVICRASDNQFIQEIDCNNQSIEKLLLWERHNALVAKTREGLVMYSTVEDREPKVNTIAVSSSTRHPFALVDDKLVVVHKRRGVSAYTMDSDFDIHLLSTFFPDKHVTALVVVHGTSKMLVGAEDGHIGLCDLRYEKSITINLYIPGVISTLDISDDHNLCLAYHYNSRQLSLVNLVSGNKILTLNLSCDFVSFGVFQEKKASMHEQNSASDQQQEITQREVPCLVTSHQKTCRLYDVTRIMSVEKSLRVKQSIVPMQAWLSGEKQNDQKTEQSLLSAILVELKQLKSAMVSKRRTGWKQPQALLLPQTDGGTPSSGVMQDDHRYPAGLDARV